MRIQPFMRTMQSAHWQPPSPSHLRGCSGVSCSRGEPLAQLRVLSSQALQLSIYIHQSRRLPAWLLLLCWLLRLLLLVPQGFRLPRDLLVLCWCCTGGWRPHLLAVLQTTWCALLRLLL
jgi:hypothetical protein